MWVTGRAQSRGLSEKIRLPKQTAILIRGIVVVPERDKFLSGTCSEMVGARPSIPYTLGGSAEIWPRPK